MSDTTKKVVALTGANGFIASHITEGLLAAGHTVHAVVRGGNANEEKVAHLRALAARHAGAGGALVLFDGDLLMPGSFDAAFAEADAVVHSAAIVEILKVKDPRKEIIEPSIIGVRNMLDSLSRAPKVRRLVHTSSVIAVSQYDKGDDYTFREADWNTWSTPENDAYGYAKTSAERMVVAAAHGERFAVDGPAGEPAALEQQLREGAAAAAAASDAPPAAAPPAWDVVRLNPGVSLGPVMTKQHTKASTVLLRQLLFGNAMLNYPAQYVDVRDVAAAHVAAVGYAIPGGARAARFVLVGDAPPMVGTALAPIAARLFPEYRLDAPPMYGPALWTVLRSLSLLPGVGGLVMSDFERLGMETSVRFDNAAARGELGVTFRPLEVTIGDGIRAMVDGGYIKPRLRDAAATTTAAAAAAPPAEAAAAPSSS